MQPLVVEAGEAVRRGAALDAGGGDELAWIARHAAGVFRFVRSLGAPRDVADELTQEAFVVAWKKGKHALPASALGAFLRRAARLLWLEQRRDRRREEAALSALALAVWERDDGGEDGEGDGEQRAAAARRCVQRLRGRAARAVELAYGHDASRERIAAELGMQPNGVKTLLARTRRWLADCIGRNP
jgi:RNA polymerase sigma-70 factor, ECF subfamily